MIIALSSGWGNVAPAAFMVMVGPGGDAFDWLKNPVANMLTVIVAIAIKTTLIM